MNLHTIREITYGTIFFRLFLYIVIGGVLGLERGRKSRPAGLRTYILVCLENQADPDDLFTAKLKSYRSEMQVSATSAQAQAAADAADADGTVNGFGMFSIPLERA